MKFINLKLGWKLALGFGLMLVMIFIIAASGLYSFAKIKAIFEQREITAKIRFNFDAFSLNTPLPYSSITLSITQSASGAKSQSFIP